MPRKIDPEKDAYAKTLLLQNLPIKKIRDELKNVFGSAISPNRLIKFKRDLKKSKEINGKNLHESIPFLFKSEISQEKKEVNVLNERIKQNTILIQKLWKKIQKIDILLEKIHPSLQKIYDLLDNNQKSDKDYHQISDNKILQEIEHRKAKIVNFLLDMEPISIEKIANKTEMNPTILEWVINQLKELGMIGEIKKNGTILYEYIY